MIARLVLIASLMLSTLIPAAWAQDDEPVLTVEQQARYDTLIHEMRCLVCQNQTIADSTAPLAADLRGQVRNRVLAGASEDEIRRYVTDRYGDFVLYKPPLRARTVLLWLGPFALLLAALGSVVLFTRGSRRRAPMAAADPEALRRLLDHENGSS